MHCIFYSIFDPSNNDLKYKKIRSKNYYIIHYMIISCLHCLPYPVTNLITKFCISDGSFTAALYLLQTYHDFLFYVNGILTAPRIFKAAQFIELT